MLDIGVTLRRYRDKYSYTQQYAADVIGISRVAYRKWENNEVDFSLSQLGKIADLYEISIQDIIMQSGFKKAKVVSQKHKARQYF
ncbi:DNA-binding transcriptional regulator, XRE-family HTH domain [Pedobacter terrae]|uniref:DNA-binding transcriptional regulator, XRE-family HTH domain n=1 Tax=Pedobacter terrae TaxID=405671 RepID=A0A1G8BH77_9SPHI|nr:helix-turn-helix transcriptional regulator [Pedobacter terrae]SDH32586.1 DNA-binding transcriptional regulator, XRE-family HTH domain [Pedobacter terrae]